MNDIRLDSNTVTGSEILTIISCNDPSCPQEVRLVIAVEVTSPLPSIYPLESDNPLTYPVVPHPPSRDAPSVRKYMMVTRSRVILTSPNHSGLSE
ncbi:hypothetical protein AVEN_19418-1 [Araneus ventricosus]|uniref:Uncharacterized protein n=1 Tax=Araneus ventricosus TaxID=182803 RepID=A0A4Y2C6E4_ARAVE|nr:hypothetical protein AVEN_19418-1 [Araneus ventricosus]